MKPFLPFVALLILAGMPLTSCSLFSKKSPAAYAPSQVEEFDPSTGTWAPAKKIIAPPPIQAETPAMARVKHSEQKASDSFLTRVKKTAVKPFGWLPWNNKEHIGPEPALQVPSTSTPAPAQ